MPESTRVKDGTAHRRAAPAMSRPPRSWRRASRRLPAAPATTTAASRRRIRRGTRDDRARSRSFPAPGVSRRPRVRGRWFPAPRVFGRPRSLKIFSWLPAGVLAAVRDRRLGPAMSTSPSSPAHHLASLGLDSQAARC